MKQKERCKQDTKWQMNHPLPAPVRLPIPAPDVAEVFAVEMDQEEDPDDVPLARKIEEVIIINEDLTGEDVKPSVTENCKASPASMSITFQLCRPRGAWKLRAKCWKSWETFRTLKKVTQRQKGLRFIKTNAIMSLLMEKP